MRITTVIASILMICLVSGCSDDSDSGTTPVSIPDVPTGLSVTDTGLTSLSLSWTAVDHASSYKLYRSESTSGTFAEVYSGPLTAIEDDGLLYAKRYYYQVSAENSAGESARSAAVDESTDIPSGFTVTGSPGGSVDFTYTHNGELNGHPLYQSSPVGLNIMHSGSSSWLIHDQIEGRNLYYHPVVTDYPSPTGWFAIVGGVSTSIVLTPF